MAFGLGEAVVTLATDNGPLKAGLSSAESIVRSSVRKLNAETGKWGWETTQVKQKFEVLGKTVQGLGGGSVRGAISSLGEGIRDVGRGAVFLGGSLTAVGAIGAGMVTSMLGSFGDFEQQITNASAVSGYFGKDLQRVKEHATDVAIQLGKELPVSASEAAMVMTDLAQRGFDAVTMSAEQLQPVLELSVATMERQETATDVLTTVLKTYGLEMENAAEVSDMLTQASIGSAAKLGFMSTAFNQLGPIMSQVGVPLAETTATLGFMADRGFKASTAGRSLRDIVTDLTVPSAKLNGVLEDLGLTTEDLDFKQHGLMGVMNNLRQAGITTEQVFSLFGKTSSAAALSLLSLDTRSNKAAEEVKKLRTEIENSGGVTHKVATEQMQTLNMQLNILKDNVNAVWIRIGQALSPVLMDLVKHLQEVVQGVEAWVEKNPELIQSMAQGLVENIKSVVKSVTEWVTNNEELIPQMISMAANFAAFAAVAGPVLVIVGGMVGGFGNMISIIPTLITGFTAVVGLFGGPLAAALVVASIGILALAADFFDVGSVMADFWLRITGSAVTGATDVEGFGSKAGEALRNFGIAAQEVFADYSSSIHEAIMQQEEELGRALTGWETFWTGVETTWEEVDWTALGQMVIDGLKFLFDWHTESWKVALETVQNYAEKWYEMWPLIKQTAWNAMLDIGNIIQNKLNEMGQWLASFFTGASAAASSGAYGPTQSGGNLNQWQGTPYSYASGGRTQGMFQRINEKGGEIVALPNNSFVIPHDVSMALAKGGMGGGGGVTVNVGTMAVREEADVRRVAQELYTLQKAEQRNRGY